MEPRLRPATRTLNKIVETIAQFVIPGRRRPVARRPELGGIWWRVTMALVLFALFLCIRKSNKLAAEVFQQEIDALDPARTKPMSA